MPLTFGAAVRLVDKTVLNSLAVGERVGSVSFVILPFLPYRFAFSFGNVLMAAESFWLFLVGRPITAGTIKSGDA
jgi:hypothetical protein